MKLLLPQGQRLNNFYLLLLLGFISISQSSCITQLYTPSTTVSYAGTTTYCQNDVATSNTLTYDQCTPGGGVFSGGTACTAQWYYNTTGGTAIGTSTPLGAPTAFTSPAGGTGTLNYVPLTTTPGTFYYFAYVTWSTAGTCTGPFTSNTQTVLVNPPPTAILGTYTVCIGSTTTLTDATASGTWSSSTTGVATVGSGTGVVTGVTLGTSTITYKVGNCFATKVVTVNAGTTPITGTAVVCVGSTTALTDVTSGGTWSSGSGNATVSPTGIVTGVTAGTAIITYTAGSCYATMIVTVANAPSAITGLGSVCIGYNSALTDATTGGTWTTSAGTGSVTIDPLGVMTGVSTGTATVTYNTSPTCWVTRVVTITPVPSSIIGPTTVCQGGTTNVIDLTPGGTWSTSNTSIATIGSSGSPTTLTGVAAGTVDITYSFGGTCIITLPIAVTGIPTVISGSTVLCTGGTSSLSDAATGGTWSSSNGSVATIDAVSGLVSAVSIGTSTISYTTGCAPDASIVVTVTTAPTPIGGVTAFCVGATSTLTDGAAGGTWSTTAGTGSVTVNPVSGLVTGVTSGTATVFYTTACGTPASIIVTVTPSPTSLSGFTSMCAGLTTTLTSTPAGGIWSTTTGTGSVGVAGGVVTGLTVGTANVTYTLGTCYVATTVSVNTTPTGITGNVPVCVGANVALNSTPGGGLWTTASGTGSILIGSGTGIITGNTAGNATVTYSLGAGCTATATVTVNNNPTAITGNTPVCATQTITLNSTPAGGTWTTSAGAGSVGIGAGTGVVTGSTAGTAMVTYTLATGCYAVSTVTINIMPTAISGNAPVCVGLTTSLNSTPAGGTWTTSAGTGSVGVGGGTGVITGSTAGTANVTYTLTGGCNVNAIVTVNGNPTAVTGNAPVCVGATATLNATPAGGTWTTAAGTGSVGIGAGTGVITGTTQGTATVTYTLSTGCIIAAEVTINANPTPITGNVPVCVGLTATLNTTPAGGTWTTTSATGSVTIGAGTGIITGATAGTANVTYTVSTGCKATDIATINPNPTTIGGNAPVCVGSIVTLNSTPAGGTWTASSGTGAMAIGGSSGIVGGLAAGTAMVTYSLATGCDVTAIVTINTTPAVITGNVPVCTGLTITLNTTPAGGTWTTSAVTGSVGIGAGTGVVTGGTTGTANVTYTLGTGCNVTAIVTVNTSPTAITGNAPLCVGLTASLNSTPAGGTWTTAAGTGSVGIGGAGIITGTSAGNATVTYDLGAGCISTATVTVNANPTIVTGNNPVCVGLTATLNSTPAGGTWTTTAGTGSVGIAAGTGIITGSTQGTANVTYTLSTGCLVTAVSTINPNPTTITGNAPVCVGLTATLNSTPAGGTWTTTSATGSVTIGAGTGIITGGTAGTANVTYTLGTGCIIAAIVTVNANPAAITGNVPVCVGLAATLSSTPAGGTWTTAAGTGSLLIGAGSGVITGSTAGNATVTYTLSTGCIASATVTVNGNPTATTGNTPVCIGLTATLNSTPAGGTWTTTAGSGTIGIGAGTGVISGTTAGTATVTYTLGTGCNIITEVTINSNPTAVTGNVPVCVGLTATLNSTPAGGTWTTGAGTGSVSIGAGTGVITGGTAGNALVTYTLSTGCIAAATVTVNANPTPVTGGTAMCVGLTTTLTTTPAGGTWTSSNGNVSVGSTGIVTGNTVGTSTITYALGTGCIVTTTVTATATPAAISGIKTVCVGATTALTDGGGGTWSASNSNTSVDGSGNVTGLIVGTSTITYTLGTGCTAVTDITVNPNPTAITGNIPVCVGLTATLNSTPAGGTWTATAGTGGVSIGAGTGVITGVAAGAANTTYTIATGCFAAAIATINPNPTTVAGNIPVCVGLTITLNSTPAGGTWTTAVGTGSISIVGATGVATGNTAGTATVTYTLGTGCLNTSIVTINPNPTSVTGNIPVCIGLTTTLNSIPSGGTWTTTAGTGSVGIGSGTGIITGNTAGTANVTYTLNTGCIAVAEVTVNANPGTITGNTPVCVGLTGTLNSTPAGGTWSTTAASGSVTISPATGVVTGSTTGTARVTYTLGTGCINTAIVTVNANPTAITGNNPVCVGLTATLNSTPAGGTWTTAAGTGSVGIGAGSGIITGSTAGNATVTYTLSTGCINTATVTVNPLPAAITGGLAVCVGFTTALSDVTASGTWSASNANASIGSGTGVVTGNSVGTVNITYRIPTGCIITALMTVNSTPAGILGTPIVCSGLSTTLSNLTAGGTWSSNTLGVATIGSLSGVMTGGTAGTATISYAIGAGCYVTTVATVNPVPTAILGSLTVCSGLTTSLSDLTTGGTWSSSNAAVGTISTTGVVNSIVAGTTTITYTLPTGCLTTAVVTVNPSPVAGVITGSLTLCPATTTALTDAAGGGVWSSLSTGFATVGTSGVVSGVAAGTSIISYTVTNGCGTVAASVVVTVNPLPIAGTITGTLSVCPSNTTALTDITGNGPGVWSSYSPALATVGTSGIVTGAATGTSIITFAVTNSCGTDYATAVVTINPLPFAGTITGLKIVCPGGTATLSDAVTGGSWASSVPTVASITSTGFWTGLALGTSTITYTATNVCGSAYTTTIVTVDPAPIAGTIMGGMVVCPGTTVTLSDPASGGSGTGVWSSVSPTIATIGSTSGVVSGVTTGTGVISYLVTNSCGTAATATTVTVHAAPRPILGPGVLCQGNTINLSDTVTDGTWSSSNALIASVSPGVGIVPTGVVSGISAGTAVISYFIAPACVATKTVTVNLLNPVTLVSQMCVGSTALATDLPGGGIWISSNPGVATIDATGNVTGIASGVAGISYSLGIGCITGTTVTVNMLPPNYNVIGGGAYCSGGTGVTIGLNGSDPGISYTLYFGSSPVATLLGTGAALDFGPYLLAGSYTVFAKNLTTGCSQYMTGTADVSINFPVPPTVAINVSPGTTICVGTTATFTPIPVNGGLTPSYIWYVNGVSVSSGSTYSYIPTSGDIVSVQLTSSSSCVSPATAIGAVVMTTTTGLMPSVTISASPGDSVCPGTPVTLTPSPVNGGTIPVYSWAKNGIYEGTGSTYTFLAIDGDNVICWMYSSLTCTLLDSVHSTNSINMTVPPIAIPSVSIIAIPGTHIPAGTTETLIADVVFTGISLSYQWEINGIPVPGATNDTFISNTFNNLDSVSCKVTGLSVCGSATREAGVIIVDSVLTGVHDINHGVADLALIPNPNNGSFTLKGSMATAEDVDVKITDMLGQVVYEKRISGQKKINEQIQLSNMLANGMYLLNVKSDTENMVFHFVIEK